MISNGAPTLRFDHIINLDQNLWMETNFNEHGFFKIDGEHSRR